jgi:hypothetical protein
MLALLWLETRQLLACNAMTMDDRATTLQKYVTEDSPHYIKEGIVTDSSINFMNFNHVSYRRLCK